MYYGHMSKTEILHSSRKFLFAIYQNYVKRACENLGVSSEKDDYGDNNTNSGNHLTEDDYPKEFMKFTQAQREKMIEKSGISDEDYLSGFKQFKNHKIVKPR